MDSKEERGKNKEGKTKRKTKKRSSFRPSDFIGPFLIVSSIQFIGSFPFSSSKEYISFSNSKANLNPAAPRSDYGRTPYVYLIISAYFSSLTSSTNY